MIHQKPITLVDTLAAIGGAVVLGLLGWAIAHPLMVLNHVAHDTARLVKQHESSSSKDIVSWTTNKINDGWISSWREHEGEFTESNPAGTLEYVVIPDAISFQCGMYPWIDRAAYGVGLDPDNGYWDLETVIKKLAEEK